MTWWRFVFRGTASHERSEAGGAHRVQAVEAAEVDGVEVVLEAVRLDLPLGELLHLLDAPCAARVTSGPRGVALVVFWLCVLGVAASAACAQRAGAVQSQAQRYGSAQTTT